MPFATSPACFFGDGAVAEGEFHECMNLAALWSLPVLFLCENNRYAMGTAIERYESETARVLETGGWGRSSDDGEDNTTSPERRASGQARPLFAGKAWRSAR